MTSTFRPRYMLSERELSTLAHQLLFHRPPRTKDQHICYFLDGRDIFSNLARHIEREVFFDKFGLDNDDMRRMYSKYEQEPPMGVQECCSAFLLVMDQSKPTRPLPVGAMRLIRYPKTSNARGADPVTSTCEPGLLTLNDAASMRGISSAAFQSFHHVTDLRKVTEVASFVVPDRYRVLPKTSSSSSSSSSSSAHLISNILIRAVLLRSTHEGMTHLVVTMDAAARRVVIDAAGLPFVPFMHGPEAMPPGKAGKRLDSASLYHEGSEDSMFVVMKLDERCLWSPEMRLRDLVGRLESAGGLSGEFKSEKQKKLVGAVRCSEVLARRLVWGEGIDHLLQFDFHRSSYRKQRRPTQIEFGEMARL